MPPRDTDPDRGHPEVAGWLLGALDSEETGEYWDHLGSCEECQAEVAGLQPVARMLATAAPAVRPPADLQARTLARVEQAARARPARTSARQWWNVRMLSVAAAVSAAAAAAVTFVLLPAAPAGATFLLDQVSTASGSGQAIARHTADGFAIQLTVHGLKDLGRHGFYECTYVAGNKGPGHPALLTAGTFTVGPNGSATVHMSSAADPRQFPTMEIIAERFIGFRQYRQVILRGTARR